MSFSKVRSCCSPTTNSCNEKTKGHFYFWTWDRNSALGCLPCSSLYFRRVTPILNLLDGVHLLMPSARGASKMYHFIGFLTLECAFRGACWALLLMQFTCLSVWTLPWVCANRAQVTGIPVQHYPKPLYLEVCLVGHTYTWFSVDIDLWCYTYQMKNHCGLLRECVVIVFFREKYLRYGSLFFCGFVLRWTVFDICNKSWHC